MTEDSSSHRPTKRIHVYSETSRRADLEFVCIFGHDEVGRNLTDPLDGFLRGKRFLILDRDKKFTTEFRDLLEHAGTDVIRLPHRSPNLNAYVERFVLSIKSECLERMIFFSEPSLRRAVAEFIHHHHGERNHQGYCQVEAFRADPTPRCWQRRALKPHHLAARFELETST